MKLVALTWESLKVSLPLVQYGGAAVRNVVLKVADGSNLSNF